MSQIESSVINEEINRSIGELSRRKETGNHLIQEIIALIEQEKTTLFYADDNHKKMLLKCVLKELSPQ